MLLLILLLIATLIFSWVNWLRLSGLRRELIDLRHLIHELSVEKINHRQSFQSTSIVESHSRRIVGEPIELHTEKSVEPQVFESEPIKKKSQAIAEGSTEQNSVENQFGAKLSVWLGAVALVLAGFFLVKYSIDSGWFNVELRLGAGALFGVGLLLVAEWVRQRMSLANGTRIGQALSGAGIAVLYGVIYAATSVYALLPPWVGLVSMGTITALAVVLSLRYGAPIALLGLLGGFCTPALIQAAAPSAALLFTYLFFVFAGLLFTVRRLHNGWLGILALIAVYSWFGFWLVEYFQQADSLWLSLFLFAVSVTTIILAHEEPTEKTSESIFAFPVSGADLLSGLGLMGAVILMGLLVNYSGFGFLEWSYFSVFALGGLVLAWYKPSVYRFLPWLILLINLVMLTYWHTVDFVELMSVVGLFAVINVFGTFAIQWRSAEPIVFASLSLTASLGYYLLSYFKLYPTPWVSELDYIWGGAALSLGLLALLVMLVVYTKCLLDEDRKSTLLALYFLGATAFISIGLTIDLPRDFLPVAMALETLAVAWVSARAGLGILRTLALVLMGVFGLLILTDRLTFQSLQGTLAGSGLWAFSHLAITRWPVFELALPSLCFGLSARQLWQQGDDIVVQTIEFFTMVLLSLFLFIQTQHFFHAPAFLFHEPMTFAESATITNVLFAFGVLGLVAGRKFKREALSDSGVLITGIALLGILLFSVLRNPLWVHHFVGQWPLLNVLSLAYLLPMLWCGLASKELRQLAWEKMAQVSTGVLLTCLFLWVTFSVAQLFKGGFLDAAPVHRVELYSYSISLSWLVLGIGLLAAGIWRDQRVFRGVALGIMGLVASKVFIVDSLELQGLYRVFSFFGLGVSLIGLSYLYSRFVFDKKD